MTGALMTSWQVIGLGGFSFGAGLVDAVVGGGGLIQLPALLVFLPEVALPLLLGTNKLASVAGTSVAMVQYGRQVVLPWRLVLLGAIAAGALSFVGAQLVRWLDPRWLRPVVLLLLMGVGGYTAHKPDLGQVAQPCPLSLPNQLGRAGGISGVIGFYDGFLGPGTGSFFIFALVKWLGFDFLRASAIAKVWNWMTNVGAIVAFVGAGSVLYGIALPMALCNIAGSLVGTRLALLNGNRFIRQLFLGVVAALIARLTYDMIQSWRSP